MSAEAGLNEDFLDLLRSLHSADVDVVYQLGLPPRRIDLLTSISGVAFEEALRTAVFVAIAGIRVPFRGREALIANKRAAGRDKDLLDIKLLERDK